MTEKKQTGSMKDSFKYALRGICFALRTERNLRFHFCFALLVIAFGFFFDLTKYEWIVVLLAVAAVITAELFNSAIENLVDIVSPEYSEQAGRIKDIASGAVLFTVLLVVIVGLIIFLPYFIGLL